MNGYCPVGRADSRRCYLFSSERLARCPFVPFLAFRGITCRSYIAYTGHGDDHRYGHSILVTHEAVDAKQKGTAGGKVGVINAVVTDRCDFVPCPQVY